MVVQWDPGISHLGLGPWFIPRLGGAWHPGPRPQLFTHQGKGTQQAIPTRSPAAQYSNSWGRWEGAGIQRKEWSGQRKNRRNCEKELWMKCEKQRYQGEKNSSKPNREDQCFQPPYNWLLGIGAGGAVPQALRNTWGWPMACAPPAHSQQGLLSWGLKLMIMPLFIHSTHLPCAQDRTAAQLTLLSALINVLSGNYLAQQRIPRQKDPLAAAC